MCWSMFGILLPSSYRILGYFFVQGKLQLPCSLGHKMKIYFNVALVENWNFLYTYTIYNFIKENLQHAQFQIFLRLIENKLAYRFLGIFTKFALYFIILMWGTYKRKIRRYSTIRYGCRSVALTAESLHQIDWGCTWRVLIPSPRMTSVDMLQAKCHRSSLQLTGCFLKYFVMIYLGNVYQDW